MNRDADRWTWRLLSGWNALCLIAAVLLVLVLQLSLNLYVPPKEAIAVDEAVSASVDGVELGGGKVPLLFSSGSSANFKPGVYRFVMEFPAGENVRQSGDAVLVVPQIAGSSLKARLVVCARHLSAGIFILAYAKILRKRLDIFSIGFAGLQATCFFLVLLYPGTIVDIKRLYGWTYLVFIPFQVYLFYLILFSGRVDWAFRTLLFGVTVAFLSSLRDIVYLVIVKDPGALMVSQHGFAILALCSSIFVIGDSIAHYRDLVAERRRTASLREESVQDALTSCYNRKILSAIAQDLGRPYAVLVVDLDGLKTVNDEYGHGTGDAVLIDLVRVLKRNVRFDDLVVRMGGDEFVIVLRSCPPRIAYEIAERLEADCAKAAVPVVASGEARPEKLGNLSYSVSIGVALGEGEGAVGLKALYSTIAEADQKMYKAKQGGKGCVVRS
jgi:diguanylate cyclase (GGDEF)-like protein